MALPTPERRISGGSVASVASTSSPSNLMFGSQRRYSRAYDQPIVSTTSKGPVVRVENETVNNKRRESSGSLDSHGKVLNPNASVLGNLVAKISIGILVLLAAVISLVGRTTLMATSQLFGFMFMFFSMFVLSSGLYLWWGVSHPDTIPLSVTKVLYVSGSSSLSGILSHMLASYAAIPVASSLPTGASYYIFLVTLLFTLFSLLAHRDNFNGMFSQETCMFVGLTVVLDFTSMCLFGDIIPSLLCHQFIFSIMLMGMTLSLLSCKFPALSPSSVYWALNQGIQHKPTRLATPQGGSLRRMSKVSIESGISSVKTRTSLSSLNSSMNPASFEYENELVTEAHGLISDLLLTKETLTNDAQTKLKRIRELLNPKMEKVASTSRRMFVGNQIGSDQHDYELEVHTPRSDYSAVSSGQLSAISSNRLSVGGARTPRDRKIRSLSVTARQSGSRFSTTTTASGMPVLDNEPADRQRSLALREVRARISVQEKRHSVHKMGRERLGSLERLSKPISPPPTSSSPLMQSHSTFESGFRSQSSLETAAKPDGDMTTDVDSRKSSMGIVFGTSSSAVGTDNQSLTSRQPVATPPGSPRLLSRGAFHSKTSEDLGVISEELDAGGRQRSATLPSSVKLSPLSGQVERQTETSGQTSQTATTKSKPEEVESVSSYLPDTGGRRSSELWVGRGERPASGYCVFSKTFKPSLDYELSEYTDSCFNVFEEVASWDFPIFDLEERAGDHILSQMAYVLFQEAGLIDTFRIPQREFISFFRTLEANYGSNVYHNKTHAADVLHGVSYLLFEMIPGFSHQFSEGHQREWKSRINRKGHGGNMASAFSILEVFACYIAAAMHDFDHPGRTNAFLVATKSPLAVLYNDRSVLENHHSAASWDLLTCVPANNFLTSLDEAEMKRFRFLIVEAILATDLKMHFDILANFKAKTNPEDGEGINWTSEVDRLMVMKIIIKMADINTPTKSYSLHRAWSERITEEFYQQAEEEIELGLPPTIFMDRKHPEKLPAIQLSFIQHLVSPLFMAGATAGIIPGVLETINPSGSQAEGDTSEEPTCDESLDLGDDAFTFEEGGTSPQKFMSILLTNLDINYDAWRAELPKEEEDETEDGSKNEKENTESQTAAEVADSADSQASPNDEDVQTPTGSPVQTAIPQVTVTDES